MTASARELKDGTKWLSWLIDRSAVTGCGAPSTEQVLDADAGVTLVTWSH
jgi:hypothetical protein